MYRVVVDEAKEQIAALPDDAVHAYAEAMDIVEAEPWSGPPFHERNPGGNLRFRHFGNRGEGIVVYLIVDHPPAVHLLLVQWLGS